MLCCCDTEIVLLCCDTEIVLLCCFVALRDTGIVSDKYLFPLKIKGCIGMFDFIMRCFFGLKSNRHWHWDSVKTIVTVATL